MEKKAGVLDGEACLYINILFRGTAVQLRVFDQHQFGSLIKHHSIWSRTWPGSLDFTHEFKSSKHEEMLDSLLILPAGLAYVSDSRHTHTQTGIKADQLNIIVTFWKRDLNLG